jgi:hypothetical protein
MMRIENRVVVSGMGFSNLGSIVGSAGSTGMPQMKRRAEFGRIVPRSASDALASCWSKRREYGLAESPGVSWGVAVAAAPGGVWAATVAGLAIAAARTAAATIFGSGRMAVLLES